MHMNNFPISVILLTHNQSDILRLQIASMEQQENVSISDFEVIITDDSSQSEEITKIKNIIKKTPITCQLLQQKSDRFWVARARNNAIKIARGKLLIFLDGDMIPETDLLSKHLLAQNNRINHIIAGHRLRRHIEFQNNNFDRFLHKCRNTNLSDPIIMHRQQAEEKKRKEFVLSNNPWRTVFGCHMSVNNSPEVRFDEHFKGWGPEDWEFAYRLNRQFHYTVEFSPHIIAYEVDHLGQGVGNVFRLKTKQAVIDYLRNTFYFFDKCPGQEIEDVFWGLRKLQLKNGEWIVTPSNKNCDLAQRIIETENWLLTHGYYELT